MKSSPSDVEAQSNPSSLSQASTIADDQHPSQTSPKKHWAVVVQSLDKSCILSQVTLQHADTGEQTWARIRYHVCSLSLARRLKTCVLMLFTTTVVGTGTIRQAQTWNGTQQEPRSRVNLKDYSDDWSLTEAFHNPHTLFHDTNHVANNDRFSIKTSSIGTKHSAQDVVVIRKTVDKTKIAWLLMVLLIISPGLGLIVGSRTRKAEVGVAVSAGLFALASFLQGLAAWFHG